MRGGLIAPDVRRHVTTLGSGEPADSTVANVVEPESVPELETEPLAIVGEAGGVGHLRRKEKRLLRRHQPATPPIQHIGINIDTENPGAVTDHPRNLQSAIGLLFGILQRWQPGRTSGRYYGVTRYRSLSASKPLSRTAARSRSRATLARRSGLSATASRIAAADSASSPAPA